MATVRITKELCDDMARLLVESRRPGRRSLEEQIPTGALVELYKYCMPLDLVKRLQSLPSRYRIETHSTINFSYDSLSVGLSSTAIPDAYFAPNTSLVYTLTTTYAHDTVGPFRVSKNTINIPNTCYVREIEADYQEAVDYFKRILQWSAETAELKDTLITFLNSQPSLNKALIAMPSIAAFITPSVMNRLNERVERKAREARDETVKTVPAIDEHALTALVMAAVSTKL